MAPVSYRLLSRRRSDEGQSEQDCPSQFAFDSQATEAAAFCGTNRCHWTSCELRV